MNQPTSPIAFGFDVLDLNTLAKATTKTLERLAPFSHLQNPSSPMVRPTMVKVVEKIKTYIGAIDASMQVVHIAYEMSKLATTLWSALPSGSSNEKVTHSAEAERQRQTRLESPVVLADEAHVKAQMASAVFRQVQQDLYRIAAATKDMDDTVQIPVDPALPKTIKKPLKAIGSDLVANMNLLADFARHCSELTTWCGWIKTGIIAIDGTVVPPHESRNRAVVDIGGVKVRWEKVTADCLVYYDVISDTQIRYLSMLPLSVKLWEEAMQEELSQSEGTLGSSPGGNHTRPRRKRKCQKQWYRAVRNLSNYLREVVRHLGYDARFIYALQAVY